MKEGLWIALEYIDTMKHSLKSCVTSQCLVSTGDNYRVEYVQFVDDMQYITYTGVQYKVHYCFVLYEFFFSFFKNLYYIIHITDYTILIYNQIWANICIREDNSVI